MFERQKDFGVLATDFSKLNQEMQDWENARNAKINLYRAFSEYILCLEKQLEHEKDFVRIVEIETEIKILKREQKKYEVKSILELAVYKRQDDEKKKTLEKSSFSLVKKFKKN